MNFEETQAIRLIRTGSQGSDRRVGAGQLLERNYIIFGFKQTKTCFTVRYKLHGKNLEIIIERVSARACPDVSTAPVRGPSVIY